MGSYQGYMRARFNSQSDLGDFVEFLREETARKPVEIDGLTVEFNFFSRGDEALLHGFVTERGAAIVERDIIQDIE